MHQVQVEVVEAGGTGHVGGAHSFVAVMDAAERLEFGRLEALYADGQAIDAEAAVIAKLGLFEGAWVGFQGDFDVGGKWHTALNAL